jgi:hypothetical protein
MTEKKKITRKKKISTAIANNIVSFPANVHQTPEITIEQIKKNKEVIRELHIEETLDIITPMLFEHIQMMGFNFQKKIDLSKDINLVVESISSLLYKYYQMDHPLQDVSDQFFVIPNMEDKNKS